MLIQKMKNKSLGRILLIIGIVVLTIGIFIFPQDTPSDSTENNIEVQKKSFSDTKKDHIIRKQGIKPLELKVDSAYSIHYNPKKNKEEVLYSYNRYQKVPIASLTKLMTALVIHDNFDLNETLKVPNSQWLSNQHLQDLKIFRDTTYKEILHLLLLESNNSVAYAAASYYKDMTLNTFIKRMNEKAKTLEMHQTHYYNPSGLDNEGTNVSTAKDLSKLTKRILEAPLFLEIMQKDNYRIDSQRRDLFYVIESTNQFITEEYFLNTPPEWQERIVGGKTGWTPEAGGCLIIIIEDQDQTGFYINILLGAQSKTSRFTEMEKLINWIHKAYTINYEPTNN